MGKIISIGKRNNILKSFDTPKVIEHKAKEDIKKGKSFPIGTVKTYGGKEYVKVSDQKGIKWGDQWKIHKKGHSGEKSTAESTTPTVEGPDAVTTAINTTTQNVNETPQQVFDNLYRYGYRDPVELSAVSALPYSEVLTQLAEIERQTELGKYTEEELALIARKTRQKRLDLFVELKGITVHDRWKTYDKILDHTIGPVGFKSMIAYGAGGVGKTWNMQQAMKRFVVHRQTGKVIEKVEFHKEFGDNAEYDDNNIRTKPKHEWRDLRQFDPTKGFGFKDYEYVVLGGSITPVMTFSSIHQHNKKIIVFDDIDKILKNKDGLDVIKGALDGEIKDISWGSANTPKDMLGNEVPKTFKFKGKAIFITNLTTEQLKTPELQPITQSRAEPVNLTMTKQETIDKLQSLVGVMKITDATGALIPSTPADLQIALDYMVEFQDLIHQGYFNARKLAALTKLLTVVNKGDVAAFRKDAATSVELPSGNQLSVSDKLGVLSKEEIDFLNMNDDN